MADCIQIHTLKPYSASCLVRGRDGRPKTMMYGGVERGRISSASLKRAIRTSDIFEIAFKEGGNLGTRSRRVGDAIIDKLVSEEKLDEVRVREFMKPVLAGFGKLDDEKPGYIRQLAFYSPEEMEQAIDLVREAVRTSSAVDANDKRRLANTVRAVDVALFGRMLTGADETIRMTAAVDVMHPFTVGKAVVEADFYVAIDDRALDDEEVASGFMGDAFFTSGLFYGYQRIDMVQLKANLGGDEDLAERAAAAFINAVAIVSPAGKRASFGSHSIAPWMMVERGTAASTSLAAAFLRPVFTDDHLTEAKQRLVSLAQGFETAYNVTWNRRIMDVMTNEGTLDSLAAIATGKMESKTASVITKNKTASVTKKTK